MFQNRKVDADGNLSVHHAVMSMTYIAKATKSNSNESNSRESGISVN